MTTGIYGVIQTSNRSVYQMIFDVRRPGGSSESIIPTTVTGTFDAVCDEMQRRNLSGQIVPPSPSEIAS